MIDATLKMICEICTKSSDTMCYVHMCQDCIRIGKFSFLIYDGTLCFFLTLALALRLLYYFSFVTAWPAGFKVDSTRVFKGCS